MINNSLDVPVSDKLCVVCTIVIFLQGGGADCGVFIVMYYVYIVSGEQFNFGTKDMTRARKWFLSLITDQNTCRGYNGYLTWRIGRMKTKTLWGLKLRDISIAGMMVNIRHVVEWLYINSTMFLEIPGFPEILDDRYSIEEQSQIVSKVASVSEDVEEFDLDGMMGLLCFTLNARQEFIRFCGIVADMKWNVYCKLLEADNY